MSFNWQVHQDATVAQLGAPSGTREQRVLRFRLERDRADGALDGVVARSMRSVIMKRVSPPSATGVGGLSGGQVAFLADQADCSQTTARARRIRGQKLF